ncbi:MAG: alpha/beta hydrolase, partial [Planctomycetota bacterium]
PQEPKPPFPYRTEDVEIETEMGHTLAGTLTLPDPNAFEPPYATGILITGSGPQDRDETILGHKPFAVLADHLARRGIASLRCDDRGFGESTGDFASATTLDFVDDAAAQVAFLTGRDGVGSIGLIGHSEGGLIAPFVAKDSSDVNWLVLLAGTGVPGREVIIEQSAAIQRASGADEALVLEQKAAMEALYNATLADDMVQAGVSMRRLITVQMRMNGVEPNEQMTETMTAQQMRGLTEQPWLRTFLELDPRPALREVTQPVLVLNGELDLQVLPDQNVPEIEKAMEHNSDVEVRVLPGLNHLFQPAETGSPSEYATIEITFDPGALEIVSGWVRRR